MAHLTHLQVAKRLFKVLDVAATFANLAVGHVLHAGVVGGVSHSYCPTNEHLLALNLALHIVNDQIVAHAGRLTVAGDARAEGGRGRRELLQTAVAMAVVLLSVFLSQLLAETVRKEYESKDRKSRDRQRLVARNRVGKFGSAVLSRGGRCVRVFVSKRERE